MSRSIVPEREFFACHKQGLHRILERAEDTVMMFDIEVSDCASYIRQKIWMCEDVQRTFEQMQISEMDSEQRYELEKRYRFNRELYEKLLAWREQVELLEERRNWMKRELISLQQYVDSSNRILDNTIENYENAR